ncbi:MAG TPA: Calx-beta domain-containing protein [Thermoanaerobaculia bacterium]|nr:Calx-beta domain-containing protein [Thermoanaerobaculia bacterium]
MVRSSRFALLLSVSLLTFPAAAAGVLSISASPTQIVEAPSAIARTTVTRTDGTDGTVSVRYATQNGTALAGTHYGAVTGTLTFGPGESVKTVDVPILNDAVYSGQTAFQLNFTDPVGATISGSSFVMFTISEDDPLPEIYLSNPIVDEIGDGVQEERMFLDLRGATRVAVSLSWKITPSTGFANEGTLVFLPGETFKLFIFRWMGDGLPGPTRTYWLNFSNVQNATASAVALTVNDYDRASLSVEDVIVTESAGHAVVTVTLSAPGRSVQFYYSTSNGTAKSWSDYGAVSGSRTIPANRTSTDIVIPIYKDQDDNEGPEHFDLAITHYHYDANIVRGNAMITILNEDVPATRVTMDDWNGRETESRATFVLRIPVTSYKDVSVVATTSGVTAGQGADYIAKTQTLTIPAGSTSTELVVDLVNDTLSEEVETFRVDLSNPTNAILTPEPFATGSIHDDDSPTATPAANVDHATVQEGQSGTTILPVRVWLDRSPVAPVELEYETENLSALAGSDYVSTTGTLKFAAGETEKFISVPVNGDTVVETNETLMVKISAVSGVLVGQAEAACIIANDDSVSIPIVFVRDASIVEGNSGTKYLSVRVELSASSTVPVQVVYATAGGTAQSGADFHSASGTLNFGSGAKVLTITVPIIADAKYEHDETFFVNVITTAGATVGDGSATCTITNDDPAPPSRRRRTRH